MSITPRAIERNSRRSGRVLGGAAAVAMLLLAVGCGAQEGQVGGLDFPPPKAPPKQNGLTLGAVLATRSPGWNAIVPHPDARGALVLAVFPGSAAETTGLRPGAVVVAVDGKEVTGADEATLLLRTASNGPHTLSWIEPGGGPKTGSVKLLPTPRFAPLAFLQRRVEEVPGDAAARYLVALLSDDRSAALANSQAVVTVSPDLAEGQILRARALLDTGRTAAGVPADLAATVKATVTRASALDPASAEVAAAGARIYLDLGDPVRALRYARQAQTNDMDSARANGALGQVQLSLRRPGEARPLLHRAVELDPYTPEHYEGLAAAYRALGQEESAIATEEALRLMRAGTTDRRPGPGGPQILLALGAIAVVVCVPLFGRRRGRPAADPGPSTAKGQKLAPRRRAELLAAGGALLIVVPYLGPALGFSPETTTRLELADHVVPGLLVIVAAMVCLVSLSSLRSFGRLPSVAGAAAALAGLYTTSAHAPLVWEAIQGRQAWGTAWFHSIPGPLVLFLAILLWRSVLAGRVGTSATPKRLTLQKRG